MEHQDKKKVWITKIFEKVNKNKHFEIIGKITLKYANVILKQ